MQLIKSSQANFTYSFCELIISVHKFITHLRSLLKTHFTLITSVQLQGEEMLDLRLRSHSRKKKQGLVVTDLKHFNNNEFLPVAFFKNLHYFRNKHDPIWFYLFTMTLKKLDKI